MSNMLGDYSNDIVRRILKTTEEINQLNDVDTILDRILLEARLLANADAGSIFLVEDDELIFSYVHNDTFFKGDASNTAIYSTFKVPITERSIVGYTALRGVPLAIDDAYKLDKHLPYQFNSSYDYQTGYRTVSILTIPLKTFQGRLVGVMQLLNAKDGDERFTSFSQESQLCVPLFANNAAVAIERGMMTRELILRMLQMAEMRDPAETGAHVQRVSAYSAEIYHRWAFNRRIDNAEIKHTKGLIRVAAMLHDVGKVGISDTILKKPGKLTPEEYDAMKWHTVFGARLFANASTELDRMCRDIALFHHEKWVGNGYPGRIPDLMQDTLYAQDSLQGEEIPLPARITALADVYDALSSQRCYKEPWPEERVLGVLEEESGRHFDPELTQAFFDNYDVIQAIQERYREPGGTGTL